MPTYEQNDGAQIDWIEYDEEGFDGRRREIIARHVVTGRTVGVRFPSEWSDVELIDALDPDYRPVVEP